MRVITARDLLFKENHDLFQQNNESTTRASRNSTMVGKGKVMSHEDIVQAQRKREKKDAVGTNGGTLVVDISDRTKAQSFTSQYLETMKHGGVRFLIFCGFKRASSVRYML
jgi:23S rRNA G2445 N2-methylase RlmL